MNDINTSEPSPAEPHVSYLSQFDDLRAIREESNQARKLRMLKEHEAKYGVVEDLWRGYIGIRGY